MNQNTNPAPLTDHDEQVCAAGETMCEECYSCADPDYSEEGAG